MAWGFDSPSGHQRNIMNVQQLKEILNNFPEDMEVVGFDGEMEECFKIIEVKITNIAPQDNKHRMHNVVTVELYFH